ncbi:lysophospholipid acyltransferase family protein [Actinoplanes sp. NPDC020271]|uniref:lysophospholipid acyltransferase family protein n=1 Tax=Actinoplanes sp. NPDC020271 TaxID=3363896 RepID=UPI00379F373A
MTTLSTLWQPASGCGDACRPGDGPRARTWTAGFRLAGMALVMLAGIPAVALLGSAAVRWLARTLLAALGVKLVQRGPVPRPGSLLVANHVSWIDILVLIAVSPVRLVAKHDVRGWPGIGTTAGRSGTIFIDRTRPRHLPATVGEVAEALRSGRSVAAFPEGTTFCGAEHGRFRPALFQAAIDAGAPVVPTSISYDSTEAAFIGQDTLVDSLLRVARVRRLTITVITAPALRPMPGADRKALARAAERSMGGHGYRLAA